MIIYCCFRKKDENSFIDVDTFNKIRELEKSTHVLQRLRN